MAVLSLHWLCTGIQLWQAGSAVHFIAQTSHCGGFSLPSTGSRSMDVSSCGTQAQRLQLISSRVQLQQLWNVGLVVPWHLESSQNQGSNLSLALAGEFLSTVPPGNPVNIWNSSDIQFAKVLCWTSYIFYCTMQLVGSQFPDQGLNVCPG